VSFFFPEFRVRRSSASFFPRASSARRKDHRSPAFAFLPHYRFSNWFAFLEVACGHWHDPLPANVPRKGLRDIHPAVGTPSLPGKTYA